MKIWKYRCSAVLGYLFGSLNFSIILSKRTGTDIRAEGSGNPGATNIARIFRIRYGVLTFLCDFLKAVVSMVISGSLFGAHALFTAGIFCLLGHCYPVFYHFKGGKGVSCGAAVSLLLDWRIFLCLIVLFLAAAFASRKVSVGSITVCAAFPVLTALFGKGLRLILFSAACSLIVLLRHKSNIGRLIQGTEPDFHAGKNNNR